MSMHILRFGDTEQHNEYEEDAHACAPQLELRSHHFLCTVRQVTCQLHAGSKDRNGTYQIPSLKDLLLPKVRMSLRWAMVKHRIKWCCCPYVSSRHHWVPSLALVSVGNLHLTHRSPCCVSHLPCSVGVWQSHATWLTWIYIAGQKRREDAGIGDAGNVSQFCCYCLHSRNCSSTFCFFSPGPGHPPSEFWCPLTYLNAENQRLNKSRYNANQSMVPV